jgi:hypothetical protein
LYKGADNGGYVIAFYLVPLKRQLQACLKVSIGYLLAFCQFADNL